MFKSKFVIGLDLGTAGIKLAVLKKTAAREHEIIIENIPWEFQHDEKRRLAYTLEVLKNLFSQKPYLKDGFLVSAIPRRSAILKYIKLPSLDKTEIANMLPFEIEKHIPLSLDLVVMDYQVVDVEDKEKQTASEIMVVVVKKDIIETHLELLAAAGFIPERVGLSSLASYSSFRQKFPQETGVVVLLDIGAQNTEISILDNGRPKFSRSVALGGDTLNQLLQKKFPQEPGKLENLKKSGQILTEDNTQFIIGEWVRLLGAEVNQSLGAFRGQVPKNKISKVFLTGGGSKLAGLAELLEKKLNVAVQAFSLGEEAFFTVAKGLAYQGLGQEKLSVNLLPKNLRKNKKELRRKKFFLVAAGVCCLMSLTLALIGYADINKKQKQIYAVEQELKSLAKEIGQARELQTKIQLLQGRSDQNEIFLETLRQLSLIAPANVCIDHLVCEREGQVVLRGKSDSHSAVAGFSIALEKSRYFEKVVNKGSREEKFGSLKLVEFEIECWLKRT